MVGIFYLEMFEAPFMSCVEIQCAGGVVCVCVCVGRGDSKMQIQGALFFNMY